MNRSRPHLGAEAREQKAARRDQTPEAGDFAARIGNTPRDAQHEKAMGDTDKRTVFFQGKHISLDEDGHLVNGDDWSAELAKHLATRDGLELSERHWRVIGFIREYYLRHKTVPMPKVVIKGLNKTEGAELYTIKYLYALFPNTPMRRACRYSGVPQPAGCT
jgi:tRNA 2-thiouridine synthesizing protein E